MKNPNGYGSVTKLSGRRRKPYMVRITTGMSVDDTGKLRQERKILGYYATQKEARQVLAEYNTDPLLFAPGATFAEVYEKWSPKKYEGLSEKAAQAYKTAFNQSKRLHDMPMKDIQVVALQAVVDGGGYKYKTRTNLKQLYNAMFKYAIANQVIKTGLNPAEYVDVGRQEEKTQPHEKFTRSDVCKLFEHADDKRVQVVLLLIYTGMRPGELTAIKKKDVHLDEHYVHVDHGKTANAVRDVPLHHVIMPFVAKLMEETPGEFLVAETNGKKYDFKNSTGRLHFASDIWKPALSLAGVLEYGEGREHTPHDCRHTFTTLWKTQKLDEAMRRKIQGHSGQGIGESVYMLPEVSDLLRELEKLWTPTEENNILYMKKPG